MRSHRAPMPVRAAGIRAQHADTARRTGEPASGATRYARDAPAPAPVSDATAVVPRPHPHGHQRHGDAVHHEHDGRGHHVHGGDYDDNGRDDGAEDDDEDDDEDEDGVRSESGSDSASDVDDSTPGRDSYYAPTPPPPPQQQQHRHDRGQYVYDNGHGHGHPYAGAHGGARWEGDGRVPPRRAASPGSAQRPAALMRRLLAWPAFSESMLRDREMGDPIEVLAYMLDVRPSSVAMRQLLLDLSCFYANERRLLRMYRGGTRIEHVDVQRALCEREDLRESVRELLSLGRGAHEPSPAAAQYGGGGGGGGVADWVDVRGARVLAASASAAALPQSGRRPLRAAWPRGPVVRGAAHRTRARAVRRRLAGGRAGRTAARRCVPRARPAAPLPEAGAGAVRMAPRPPGPVAHVRSRAPSVLTARLARSLALSLEPPNQTRMYTTSTHRSVRLCVRRSA